MIPCPCRLFQTIQGLVKLTHEMFTSLVHEPLRLFHVNLLFKLAIEKWGFHVHLMDLHVFQDPNDMKFLSHIYSFMIYTIPKLQIQKSPIKGNMTKKPNLAQSLQRLITLTKHILFFWKFENRSILYSFIIFSNFHSKIFS